MNIWVTILDSPENLPRVIRVRSRDGQSLSTFEWIDRAPRKELAPGAEAFSGAESIHRIVPLEKEPAPGAEAFSGAESIHAPRKGTCPWGRGLFWGRI